MDILKEFSTDAAKEVEGIEVEIGDATFIVARANNRAYNKLLTSLIKKHKRELDMKNEASEKLDNDLMAEVMAKTIVKGWSGVTEGGTEVPYTYEKALAYLKVKDFRTLIAEKANDFTLYRAAVEEEISGN